MNTITIFGSDALIFERDGSARGTAPTPVEDLSPNPSPRDRVAPRPPV
ncbi:MAG: hypothetical protein ABSG37_04155 [Candidatus Limnocylindrales bacterium]|jgi:hypothetical protein